VKDTDDSQPVTNRDKKVQGRAKKRKYVQGTRSYLHALTNSMARRSKDAKGEDHHDQK
jgi:hypothetical protein